MLEALKFLGRNEASDPPIKLNKTNSAAYSQLLIEYRTTFSLFSTAKHDLLNFLEFHTDRSGTLQIIKV